MGTTLFIVKPDAVESRSMGRILARVEEHGFRIAEMALTRLSVDDARRFYAVHAERPFFDDLCRFMSSGPCVPCLIEGGERVVEELRELIGATDPAESPPGTLRRDFGGDKERNAVHGSDAPQTARQEIAFFAARLGWAAEPARVP